MEMKFVSRLTDEQRSQLQRIVETDPHARTRQRAHAVLLSDQGYSRGEIADIYQVKADTVSGWLAAWETRAFQGLYDAPRSGRPKALNEAERERAIDLIKESPRQLKRVIHQLRDELGKTVSRSTLKRVISTAKGRWKRARHSLRSKRDPEAFDKGKREVEDVRRRKHQQEIELFYFDESGFCLDSSIPYAYQFPGEELELPSSKSARLNVLGFLSPDMTFHSFVFECSVNSEVVIACFDSLSERITQETWVVLDNASMHTSDAFESALERWKAKGLFVYRLPAYSPELNLIEILWRFMKYFWLPCSAYTSFDALVHAVEEILRKIGDEFVIHFKDVPLKEIAATC
jgi:transposase